MYEHNGMVFATVLTKLGCG